MLKRWRVGVPTVGGFSGGPLLAGSQAHLPRLGGETEMTARWSPQEFGETRVAMLGSLAEDFNGAGAGRCDDAQTGQRALNEFTSGGSG